LNKKKIKIRQILKVVKENKCFLKEIAQDAGDNYLEACIVDEANTLCVWLC
jgi:hypothetical protein